MYQRLLILCFALATLVPANRFLDTCRKVGLTVNGRTLVADCKYKDQTEHEKAYKSALDLNRCFKLNDGGDIIAETKYVHYHGMMVLRSDWKQWKLLFQCETMSS